MSLTSTDYRHKILVITGDTLGAKMAGPAMRAWHIAQEVSTVAEVRLVSTTKSDIATEEFMTLYADDAELRRQIEWCEVIIFQGHVIHHHPWIAETDKIIVADIYDPMHLETLEQGKFFADEARMDFTLQTTEVLNVQIERADFMLCASEKQRDFWLGQLAAMGRINPLTYDEDASLRSLLAVAPFGVTNEEPVQLRHALKGTVPGINEDDKVLLWGGGIYNWFDPLTLIKAVDLLRATRPNLRLFFLGMAHPNPDVPIMEMSVQARELADELGLNGTHVFFNNEWVAYADRVNYLLDSDLGVSTHFEHVETAFSFRTRILDYLWAGLPIVATGGDTFDAIITGERLGATVDPEDVDALARAIDDVVYGDNYAEYAENARRIARKMTWADSLAPLVEFCASPRRAPDLVAGATTVRNRQRAALEIRVAGLENSTSWKLTAPLRAVMRRLGR
ncbi:glycosyltransferase [Mycetocola spongiae]|nr:glycosyltransferase [Mycetocola spongiae]